MPFTVTSGDGRRHGWRCIHAISAYQHKPQPELRFSSVAEIAGGMGLRSPQPQQLALDFAPAQVRSHGLRDAHTHPQVARRKGESFRVPASQAWVFAYLELRAGNSWPLMGFDCDVPSAVVDALYWNHHGGDGPALPRPNMVVERRSQFAFARFLLPSQTRSSRGKRKEAPLRLLARSASSTAMRSALILGTTAS